MASFQAMDSNAEWNRSEAALCSILMEPAASFHCCSAFQPMLRSFLMVQRISWPNPTMSFFVCFFLAFLKIIWEPDLVSPAHDKANKVKQSELQHASTWKRTLQGKMSFPINARVIMTLPLVLNRKLEDSSFPSGIPKLCVSFQQGPAANFLNKPGKWDASSLRLTTKKTNFFVVFLNKLADQSFFFTSITTLGSF